VIVNLGSRLEQIGEILDQRAKRGLVSHTAGTTSEIAGLAAKKTNSDVRVAIKTLYYVATARGDTVQASFEQAQRDVVSDLICDLNYNNLLILKAASQSKEGLVKDVYARYSKLCADKSEKPFCYAYFYNNLSYLQSLGLILLASTKIGRTYTNRINLLFYPTLLHGVHQTRLGGR